MRESAVSYSTAASGSSTIGTEVGCRAPVERQHTRRPNPPPAGLAHSATPNEIGQGARASEAQPRDSTRLQKSSAFADSSCRQEDATRWRVGLQTRGAGDKPVTGIASPGSAVMWEPAGGQGELFERRSVIAARYASKASAPQCAGVRESTSESREGVRNLAELDLGRGRVRDPRAGAGSRGKTGSSRATGWPSSATTGRSSTGA